MGWPWEKKRTIRVPNSGAAGGALSLSVLADGPQEQQERLLYSPRSWSGGGASGSRGVFVRGSTSLAAAPPAPSEIRALQEVVARHEATISGLQGNMAALVDAMRHMQDEWEQASRAIFFLQQQQATDTKQAAADTPEDGDAAGERDAGAAPCHSGHAAANTTAATAPTGAAVTAPVNSGAPGTAAGDGSVSLGDLGRSLANATAAVSAVQELHRFAARFGEALPSNRSMRDQADRDDCASTISFATTRSIGSTMCSAPVLLTEFPTAGRGTARVGTLGTLSGALGGLGSGSGGGPVLGGAAAVLSALPAGLGGSGLDGCDVPEECSREQLEEAMEQLRTSNSSSSEESSGADAERRRSAAVTLALHTERDAELRAALVRAGLLDEVAAMLEGNDPRCRWAAAHIAWYVSRSDELRSQLGGPRVIGALVTLLGETDPAVARAAALALNNLALEAECRQTMADAGAITALIDMMASSDAIGQEAASAALMMLGSEEANIRALIVAANGVRALVSVLQYGGPTAQESAACALENLSLDAACESALGQEGGVEGLLGLLRDGTPAAQAAAIGALRNLAVNDDLQLQLLSAGGVTALLAMARSGAEPATRTAAVEALRNLAVGSSEACTSIVAAGGTPTMVQIAHELPGAGRLAALGVLLVLSVEEPHKQAVMQSGAVGILVHAALSGSPAAKEYAARTLTNLATSDANRIDILKEGAATVLAALLRTGASSGGSSGAAGPADRTCRYVATRALQNLSKCRQPQARRQMLDAGCVPALVGALSLDAPTAGAAVSALCALSSLPRALQELARADGAGALLSALSRLQGRSQQLALRLLRRLAKRTGAARVAIQDALAGLGLPQVLAG